jgi:hypothetical protein
MCDAHGEVVENMMLRHSPTFGTGNSFVERVRRMTREELRILKGELQQLHVELKGFKKELLATRAAELGQLGYASGMKPRLRLSEVNMFVGAQGPAF